MSALISTQNKSSTLRLLKHPDREFYQCTSQFRLEMLSDLYEVDGDLVFRYMVYIVNS